MQINILDKEAEMKTIAQIQQLKAELQKMKDTECDLRCENEQLKTNIQHHISETDNVMKKLESIKQKETEYEELLLNLEDGKKEVITFNPFFTLFLKLFYFLYQNFCICLSNLLLKLSNY
jgi:regulator of replication initiation timing